MNKRLLFIGVLLFLFGLLLSYESGQQFLSNLSSPNDTVAGQFYLGPNVTGYLPVAFNSPSLMEVSYNSTNAINFYIVNSSAFYAMEQYLNSTNTLSQEAVAFEGRGTVMIIKNEATGVFPYQSAYAGIFPMPNYSSTNESVLPPDEYYTLFRNPGASNALIFYSLFSKPVSSIGITSGGVFGYGIMSALFLIGGFALCVYALFMKRDDKETVREKEESVDKMYEEIERKEPKRKGKRRKGRKARKRR